MQWSATNTIPAMQNKSTTLKEIFAKAANSALDKGMSKEEAIFAGTSAVKIQEKKDAPAKVQAPKVPAHLQAVRSYQDPYSVVSKAIEPPKTSVDIQAVEFDNEGHLIVLMQDGRKIKSKTKAVEQHIDQRIGVSVNPVFDHVQMNRTANYTADDLEPGMLTWNEFEDCLDIVQNDSSVLQVGLEHYIEVVNNTSETMPNGSIVRFAGVSQDEIPEAYFFLADGNTPPLYIIGVLTNELIPGQRGRATVFGKVRNINTSGLDVGEPWERGDLLWAHPTMPGKLTKYQPTAPNTVIAVAVVLKVDSAEGRILVRPTIFPRLFYGTFSSSIAQTPALINTPYAVTFDTVENASGFHIDEGSKIHSDNSGLYSFDFRMQLTSNNSSKKEVYIWARKNGVDIPKSNSKITISGNDVEAVPSWSFTISMQIGDYFQLMYATTDTSVIINAPAATSFAPSTPAVTLRVSQINL